MDMDTQTSETMDTKEGVEIDLFAEDDADFAEEPTSETGEDLPESQEIQSQQKPEDNTAKTMLDIVYNGQQMQLTQEQAVELAQKGMNYDKKLLEIEQLKNSPERQLLSRLAEQSGLSYEQFLNHFEDQIKQSTISVRAEQFVQNGMDMDTAMTLAQSEIEKEELQNWRNAEEQKQQQFRQQFELKQQAELQRREQFVREISELVKENPNFQQQYPTVESMPQVMQDAILNGGSIKQAYQQVVIEELRNENAAYKQNQRNKGQSPGSASGSVSSNSDAFLNSLFGDD